MKVQKSTLTGIFVASVLAVIGLVVFQLTWMHHSRKLSEEIFNQRVCMALCSTVENYSGGILCGQGGCGAPGLVADGSLVSANDLVRDSAFQADLRQSLDFHQIDLDYELSIAAEKQPCGQTHQCSVALPSDSGNVSREAFLAVSFPEKEAFVSGGMSAMVLATVLILLFTTAVLLFANWSLMKQKRLLQTNVDFFNNMAHEFRTPLTNMGLAVNMLAKKQPELKDSPLLDILRRENVRLLHEVERVLHLASLDNGDYALQKERLPLRPLLQSVLDDMEMRIAERQARVKLDEVPERFEVFGDRQHLANVFRNLLDNALKYTLTQPDVLISAKEQARGILITVQDNGIGIPAGQRELIFEKFQRAGQGDLHEQKGFGLGLAYVKSMVEMHRGFVRVSSEEQRGSRFEVFLPAFSAA